jgi:hypothetical protein
MRIATVSEVPTRWLCLQEDLRQAGVDPARLDRITDRSMAENLNALTEGRIEAAQFFEPVVEQAFASGKGHLWYAASARGRTSYTAFVTIHERARSRFRTLIVHGQSNPADTAMDLFSVCAGDCRGHFLVLPSARHRRAGRRQPVTSSSLYGDASCPS